MGEVVASGANFFTIAIDGFTIAKGDSTITIKDEDLKLDSETTTTTIATVNAIAIMGASIVVISSRKASFCFVFG
jgi:hypothetical protein